MKLLIIIKKLGRKNIEIGYKYRFMDCQEIDPNHDWWRSKKHHLLHGALQDQETTVSYTFSFFWHMSVPPKF